MIIGDSISMGYTGRVKDALKEQYYVTRPNQNCKGTTFGVEKIDDWLELEGGNWDLIHFNFGLHDLKRVHPETRKNSNDPKDPNQAEPQTYEKQLTEIVAKLKSTKAKLVFATTTPVPPGGVTPHRDPTAPAQYNEIAKAIMVENGIAINDLFSLVEPVQLELLRSGDVHFKPAGNKKLADQVIVTIASYLKILETRNTGNQ